MINIKKTTQAMLVTATILLLSSITVATYADSALTDCSTKCRSTLTNNTPYNCTPDSLLYCRSQCESFYTIDPDDDTSGSDITSEKCANDFMNYYYQQQHTVLLQSIMTNSASSLSSIGDSQLDVTQSSSSADQSVSQNTTSPTATTAATPPNLVSSTPQTSAPKPMPKPKTPAPQPQSTQDNSKSNNNSISWY